MGIRFATAVLLAVTLTLASIGATSARAPVTLGYSHEPAGLQDMDMDIVDATAERLGTTPALWTIWSNWGSRLGQSECLPNTGRCAFPGEAAAGLMARGITPFIWWTPVAPPGQVRGEFARYIHIIDGHHDDYIRRWATAAGDHGGPILLRFAHEMNGRWYPWALTRFDNTPERFVKAWRHIWRIFRDVGASNVRFVWSPSREGCRGCEPNYPYEDFYPGNRYVDYVGLNAYNAARHEWRSMATVLERPMPRLQEVTRSAGFPRGKPVILGEVGSTHEGGNKAGWIRDGYNDVFRRWPRIKAIVYFDVDMRERNASHPDWRLTKPADGSALRTYQQIAALPRFRGQLP